MIAAGRLRHRITIQQRVETQTDTGATTIAWTDFAVNVPAEFKALSVREFLAGGMQIGSNVTAKIVIRYRDGLLPTMRIVFRNQFYNIAGLLADDNSGLEYITIPVTTGINDG